MALWELIKLSQPVEWIYKLILYVTDSQGAYNGLNWLRPVRIQTFYIIWSEKGSEFTLKV